MIGARILFSLDYTRVIRRKRSSCNNDNRAFNKNERSLVSVRFFVLWFRQQPTANAMNRVLLFSAGHLISENAILDTHRLKLVGDIGETLSTKTWPKQCVESAQLTSRRLLLAIHGDSITLQSRCRIVPIYQFIFFPIFFVHVPSLRSVVPSANLIFLTRLRLVFCIVTVRPFARRMPLVCKYNFYDPQWPENSAV